MLPDHWSSFLPALLLFCLLLAFRTRRDRPLPPGPKPLPLLGNLLDIPKHNPWLTFSEWRHTYGDIVHVNALGQHLIILNDLEAVTDLFDRRRAQYSGRPILEMAGNLMGTGDTMSFSQPNERWKTYRKFSRQALNKQAVKSFRSLQMNTTLLYLQSLLHDPNNFVPELRLAVGRIILSAIYGFSPVSAKDHLVTLIEYCLNEVSGAAVPGAYLVDLIPALKYLPAWFPGAGFKRKAEHVRLETLKMMDVPFYRVKQQLAECRASSSYVADLLQTVDNSQENDYNIKWSAGTMYAAGMDTTYATVLTFMGLMLKYPEAQGKAQKEIDNLLCGERLPTFDDITYLPYCEALIKEINRFNPPVRLSIPRRCTEVDEYKGFHIPKNSTIIPNVWEISRDPKHYVDPEKFWPERFLDKEKVPLDPTSYIFGFGSRSCPGIFLAQESLRILIVSILAGFNCKPTKDEAGNDVIPDIKYTPTLTCVPLPFPCRIEPRAKYADFIRNVQAEETKTH